MGSGEARGAYWPLREVRTHDTVREGREMVHRQGKCGARRVWPPHGLFLWSGDMGGEAPAESGREGGQEVSGGE